MTPGWQARVKAQLGALSLDVDLRGDAAPVALVGPNGSGKTTLLRVLAGAYTPDEGEIRVGDTLWFDAERGIDLPCEQRRVGYVPQGFGLFPHMRALDNVAFGLAHGPGRLAPGPRRSRARALLEDLGSAALAERHTRDLSGGEQQRVALARALVIEPAMLLLDEPLAALDVGARRKVRGFLAQRVHELARPTLVVTHDPRDAVALGAWVCVLEQGRIVQQGSVEALRAAPATEFVAELFEAEKRPPPRVEAS